MATIKQKKAFDKIVENRGNVSKAMREVGYDATTAKNPRNLTESKGFKELMNSILPDADVLKRHKELLNSQRIDHMVFPLGPKDKDDENFSGAKPNTEGRDEDGDDEAALPEKYKERTKLTDKEIIKMLAEVSCKVRRIVHGENARHVYFWSPDNRARKDAIDMAYKIKGKVGSNNTIIPIQVNFGGNDDYA